MLFPKGKEREGKKTEEQEEKFLEGISRNLPSQEQRD